MVQIENNFTEMLLMMTSIKIAQIVLSAQKKRAARALDKIFFSNEIGPKSK